MLRVHQGFAPANLSNMINERAVGDHIDLASGLWALRGAATRALNYRLSDLVSLDERIHGNLAGIALAGDRGLQLCAALLEEGALDTLFVETWTLVVLQRDDVVLEAWRRVLSDHDACGAIRTAIGFLPDLCLQRLARHLTRGAHESTRRIPALALAVETRDRWRNTQHWSRLQASLVGTLEHPGEAPPPLVEAYLEAAYWCGFLRFLPASAARLPTETLAPMWARAAVRVPSLRSRALAVLDRVALAPDDPFADVALALSIRARGRHAPAQYRKIAPALPPERAHVAAVAAGDPALVADLIADVEADRSPFTAGFAFGVLLGVDLEDEDLVRDLQDAEALGPGRLVEESGLPPPDPQAMVDYARRHQGRFAHGERILGGFPIDALGLRRVLAGGSQAARRAAAEELSLHTEGVVPQVAAPGYLQREQYQDALSE